MSKKEEKKRQRRQQAVKFVIIPYIFGIAMLLLGIFGLRGNNADLKAYQNSDDVRFVDAEVTYSARKQTDPLPNERPEPFWDAELRFTVDGTEYSGKDRFYSEVKKGDTVRIEVYRTADGDYRIPTVTTESGSKLKSLLMYAAIAVGALVTIASTFYLVDELRKNKKGNGGGNQ